MKDKVQLLGWKDQNEVVELFKASHLFIFTSVTTKDGNKESQALAVQEAQAVGLPLIATIYNGVPEGMLENRSGFLVPEKDVTQLTEKLDYLVNHPEIWSKMGHIGRAFVEEKFEISKVNQRLIQIYKSLFDEKNGVSNEVHFEKLK